MDILRKKITPRTEYFAKGSDRCLYFFRGQQSAGDIKDVKRGMLAVKDAGFSDAECWANPGFITTGGSVTDYATVAAGAGHDFTLDGYSLIFSLRIKKATPATNEVILGSFTSGSVYGGLQLTANSSGSLSLAISPADGSAVQSFGTSGALDGNEHTCTWFIPRNAVSAVRYVDLTNLGTLSSGTVPGKSCAGGNILAIGASRAGSAKVCQFAAIQAYQVPLDLASINTDRIQDFLLRQPHRPIPDWMLA